MVECNEDLSILANKSWMGYNVISSHWIREQSSRDDSQMHTVSKEEKQEIEIIPALFFLVHMVDYVRLRDGVENSLQRTISYSPIYNCTNQDAQHS